MSKILVSYFSASGVTKDVAKKLALSLRADLFEIEPVQKYSAVDLDWNNPASRSSVEMNDPSNRPKIKESKVNLAQYDKILVGFPIWWGVAPRVINTFIEENDFGGKDIYVFATSGGSGISTSFEDLKKNYPDLHFKGAKLLFSYMSNDDMTSWIF